MKNRVLTILTLIIISTIFCFTSCEQSNIALAEIIRTSQPRNDIRWSEARIVKNTTSGKADAAILISEKGVHVIKSNADSLATPTIANDVNNYGVFSRVFIPINYDATNKVILEALSNKIGKNQTKYFALTLDAVGSSTSDTDPSVEDFLTPIEFTTPTEYDEDYGFVPSRAFNSENVVYRTDDGTKYTYCITRFTLDVSANTFTFYTTDAKYFVDKNRDRKVVYLFESDNKENAVATYTIHQENENKYSLRYATIELGESTTSNTLSEITAISEESGSTTGPNLYIDYFKVYDGKHEGKIEWMGISRTGIIYHSHSTDSQLKTSDAAFSFYRYVAPASLDFTRLSGGVTEDKDDTDGDKYGLMLFARYNGSGFIVTRFLRHLNNNRLVVEYTGNDNRSYQNTYVITSGFVENYRTEEMSVFAPITGIPNGGTGTQSLIVLTTEVGASTYQLWNNPYAIANNSSAEIRDKIDIPFV